MSMWGGALGNTMCVPCHRVLVFGRTLQSRWATCPKLPGLLLDVFWLGARPPFPHAWSLPAFPTTTHLCGGSGCDCCDWTCACRGGRDSRCARAGALLRNKPVPQLFKFVAVELRTEALPGLKGWGVRRMDLMAGWLRAWNKLPCGHVRSTHMQRNR